MEVVDLGLNETEPISLNIDDIGGSRPNFGAGLELLMNDKMKTTNFGNSNVDLGELDQMEQELNELSGRPAPEPISAGPSSSSGGSKSFFGNWFGGGSAPAQNDSHLGEATASSFSGTTKTSDGYGKISTEIPIEAPTRMTERERRRKKRHMLKKLDEWYEKGIIKNNPGFNLDSNYEEIEDEYEGALEDKRKKDAIKVQGWWFMTIVNSIEYGNAVFDPFGLNLDGWGEQVSEDLDSYEDIFVELYQKYKGGKLAPELALIMRLGFSAAMVNFTNKALSSATPGFNDVIRQSPELMKMFTNATVQSMSQTSPGFAMASELLQPRQNREPDVNTNFGPPPPAVATKNQPPPQRHPLSNMQFTRPDIVAARGGGNDGIDLQEGTPIHGPSNMTIPRGMQAPVEASAPPSQDDRRTFGSPASLPNPTDPRSSGFASKRPEMRGPQNMDLNNILSNLKVKPEAPSNMASAATEAALSESATSRFFGGASVGARPPSASAALPITQPVAQPSVQDASPIQIAEEDAMSLNTSVYNENDSMISISSLRELQNANVPKRGGRRRKNQPNQTTISLDI